MSDMEGWFFVTGTSHGLGYEIAKSLTESGKKVWGLDKTTDAGIVTDGCWCDVRDPESIDRAFDNFRMLHRGDEVSCLINNAGVNRIDWLEDVATASWDNVMNTNARGIFLVTQALLPLLAAGPHRPLGGTVLNIVSNASHVPMRSSLAYNASKAAAHIMTLQLGRELGGTAEGNKGMTVFGISPNKLRGTKMSEYIQSAVPRVRGWTEKEAEDYQQKSLAVGEETEPREVAEFITFLLSYRRRHKYLNGCVLPYGA